MSILNEARAISEIELPSTKHLSPDDKLEGTCQMLDDLERLAEEDGCIAAAWAIEWVKAVAGQRIGKERP